jgi:hypothetical protein
MLILHLMNAKSSTSEPTTSQPAEMSDPTKYILRCVELRKRKAAETQLLTIRLRQGSTTPR